VTDHETEADRRGRYREDCRREPLEARAWLCGDPHCDVLHPTPEAARSWAWRDCPHGGVPAREYCRPCSDGRAAAAEARRRAAAREVALADYTEEYVVLGDEYVLVDDLEDRLADMDPDERLAWVWGTRALTPSVDPDDLAQRLTEDYVADGDDGHASDFPGWAELVKAIEAFNALQVPTCWEEDASVVVVLPPPRVGTEADETAAKATPIGDLSLGSRARRLVDQRALRPARAVRVR
jgi:hypothetical protein